MSTKNIDIVGLKILETSYNRKWVSFIERFLGVKEKRKVIFC